MWCVPDLNDEYVRRMENLLRLYKKEYDNRQPVVCLDEKPVQLLADTRPMRTTSKAVRQRDYEYRRCGTANIFCAVEPKAGRHFIKVTNSKGGVAPEEIARVIAERKAKLVEARKRNLARIERLEKAREKLFADLREFCENAEEPKP